MENKSNKQLLHSLLPCSNVLLPDAILYSRVEEYASWHIGGYQVRIPICPSPIKSSSNLFPLLLDHPDKTLENTFLAFNRYQPFVNWEKTKLLCFDRLDFSLANLWVHYWEVDTLEYITQDLIETALKLQFASNAIAGIELLTGKKLQFNRLISEIEEEEF